MSVDPVDDCTFWFTTEYMATTGTNWQTRIGSFKLTRLSISLLMESKEAARRFAVSFS